MSLWFDSHNHLQDPRLDRDRQQILEQLPILGIAGAVVNGTQESDWHLVQELAAKHSWIVPSFGLHPWYVNERSPNWLSKLESLLQQNPKAAIGECGLDRWIEGHDPVVQSEVFSKQLQLAVMFDRPITVHCIRAWGALLDILQSAELPRRGLLIHAFAGSLEIMHQLSKLGAYFSFSTYFLHGRKAAQREVFTQIPADRLLIETDAPDMAPPPDTCIQQLGDSGLNHPANILAAAQTLASLRNISLEELSALTAENHRRLFVGEP